MTESHVDRTQAVAHAFGLTIGTEEFSAIERHAAACADCAHRLRDLRRSREILRTAIEDTPLGEIEPRPRSARPRSRVLAAALAAGLCLATVGVALFRPPASALKEKIPGTTRQDPAESTPTGKIQAIEVSRSVTADRPSSGKAVSIDLGSLQGVRPGSTFEVVRGSEVLGTVTIAKMEETWAAGSYHARKPGGESARVGDAVRPLVPTAGSAQGSAEQAPQGPGADAERVFRSIESRMLGAKSIRVRYSVEGSNDICRTGGTFALGESGKMNYECLYTIRADVRADYSTLAVSNGTTLRMKVATLKTTVSDADTPPRLREKMVRQLVSFGLLGPVLPRRDDQIRSSNGVAEYDMRAGLPWDELRAYDFKRSVDEGGSGILAFRVKVDGLLDPYAVKLWYDPATLRLRRRVLVLEKVGIQVAEVYDEFAFDGEIPNETFVLPKKE
jgi:hypothetical protein